jgi:hypothetical protein
VPEARGGRPLHLLPARPGVVGRELEHDRAGERGGAAADLGAAAVQQSTAGGGAGFEVLHACFLDRLLPVAARLLEAAAAGEIRADIDAYQLLRGVGNLCIGADSDPRYDARRLVGLLLEGLRRPPPR